jgi:ABC-2 type transport system ATP-binding protein
MSTVERLDEAVLLTQLSAYGVRFPDLIVRFGEVVVPSGPNGSGKSTVSRVLVGELAAEGTARVLGANPLTADFRGRIGFLVKDLETMGSLTSRDVLDICAAVRDCGTTYAHELADRLALDLDRPMAQLSRCQLRRLGIVQALMHEPELIVLDDPTSELDDEARQVLRPCCARQLHAARPCWSPRRPNRSPRPSQTGSCRCNATTRTRRNCF